MTLTRIVAIPDEQSAQIAFLAPGRSPDSRFPYRISPIFPLRGGEADDPTQYVKGSVGFFFSTTPFVDLGHVRSDFCDEDQRAVWFSHGLASIVTVSTDHSLKDRVIELIGEHLCAYEMWDFDRGRVLAIDCHPPETPPHDSQSVSIGPLTNLDPDIFEHCMELQRGLDALFARAARYAPSCLTPLQRLVTSVRRLLDEIRFFQSEDQEPPASLSESVVASSHTDPVERGRRLHQRLHEIVQITSGLSYVVSQGFSGIVPILAHECPIRRYSLLGVGAAHQGLAAFTGHIETVFEGCPIDTVVRDHYKTTIGAHPAKTLDTYHYNQWRGPREENTLDLLVREARAQSPRPKLAYYSARQGFRETKAAVTAPVQVIPRCATIAWSPMTLSHEMLHAHVSGIVAALFGSEARRPSQESFAEYYDDFCHFHEDEDYELPPRSTCLRNMILNYCRFRLAHDRMIAKLSQANEKLAVGDEAVLETPYERLPSMSALWEGMAGYYRDINEIIVHVLDFYYFYDCNEKIYLELLWKSWSTVPEVLGTVEQYVMRSVVAIASAASGTLRQRFERAAGVVARELARMHETGQGSAVIGAAKECLDDEARMRAIRLVALPGIYLADVTTCFLRSSQLATHLVRDELVDLSDGEPIYRMECGEFSGESVRSPVSLCLDVLRSADYEDRRRELEEERGAWLLLACGSATPHTR